VHTKVSETDNVGPIQIRMSRLKLTRQAGSGFPNDDQLLQYSALAHLIIQEILIIPVRTKAVDGIRKTEPNKAKRLTW
jgi:hypothetical protein